jgi:hypothetical protein
MGKILYFFHFALQGSDYYLGQLLLLKDMMCADYNLLYPHGKDLDNPMMLEGILL